jgi:Mn2+/Fe2+ NRAMP family transporter
VKLIGAAVGILGAIVAGWLVWRHRQWTKPLGIKLTEQRYAEMFDDERH